MNRLVIAAAVLGCSVSGCANSPGIQLRPPQSAARARCQKCQGPCDCLCRPGTLQRLYFPNGIPGHDPAVKEDMLSRAQPFSVPATSGGVFWSSEAPAYAPAEPAVPVAPPVEEAAPIEPSVPEEDVPPAEVR